MSGVDPATPVDESMPTDPGPPERLAQERSGRSRSSWGWRFAAVLWLVLVWWALESPPMSLPALSRLPALPWIPGDVVAHGLLFWVTAWLLHRAMLHRRPLAAALLLAVGYGLITELHQLRVPGRATELGDLLSNATGSGLYGARAWWRRR